MICWCHFKITSSHCASSLAPFQDQLGTNFVGEGKHFAQVLVCTATPAVGVIIGCHEASIHLWRNCFTRCQLLMHRAYSVAYDVVASEKRDKAKIAQREPVLEGSWHLRLQPNNACCGLLWPVIC